MKMVPTNVKIHLGHASTKKMVKIDPNSTSAYRYKKVFGMGKVAVVGGSGQHDVLDSSKKVIDNPSSGGALESSIVVGKDQPKPEHVQLQDVQPVALAHDAPYTAIEAKQPLEKERKIEPWTWEMVRNMDDNDIQATSVDALGVTLRSFILACIG